MFVFFTRSIAAKLLVVTGVAIALVLFLSNLVLIVSATNTPPCLL